MELYIKPALIYLLFISLLSAAVCIYDKLSAKRNGRRISERSLIILCLLGGSVAMYTVMRIIRHKTRHNKFMMGIPIIIVFQVAILLTIAKFYGNF